MLAFNFFDHHFEGGLNFMLPLTILFAADLALIAFMLLRKNFSDGMFESVKHISLLVLVYGLFGTLYGFLQMFDALESIKEELPRQMIAGGVKVALLNAIYGFAYFCILLAGQIVAKILSVRQLR